LVSIHAHTYFLVYRCTYEVNRTDGRTDGMNDRPSG